MHLGISFEDDIPVHQDVLLTFYCNQKTDNCCHSSLNTRYTSSKEKVYIS